MTLESDQTVRLCLRDWVAIIALVITIGGALITNFIYHDRVLTQLVVQTEVMNKRLDKIEAKLER